MKYILMFFTFLSVCTTAELLQIPLTLDTTRTVVIPQGATLIAETITVSPSDDPDFQKYLDKIKGYTIESVSFSSPNPYIGGSVAIARLMVDFPAAGFSTKWVDVLYDGRQVDIGLTGEQLVKMAESIQKNGKMDMKVSGSTYGFFGELKLTVKINLKIKV
ncbi:MAG: hypothetical protein RLY11_1766 [Bacteroidota bacterium]|jgi:hypothetical protein|nr:hypothetical protein [Chitinophagia bacterium]